MNADASEHWPCAKLRIDGDKVTATQYAPGLPDGEHDVWCVKVDGDAAYVLQLLILGGCIAPEKLEQARSIARGVAEVEDRKLFPWPEEKSPAPQVGNEWTDCK